MPRAPCVPARPTRAPPAWTSTPAGKRAARSSRAPRCCPRRCCCCCCCCGRRLRAAQVRAGRSGAGGRGPGGRGRRGCHPRAPGLFRACTTFPHWAVECTGRDSECHSLGAPERETRRHNTPHVKRAGGWDCRGAEEGLCVGSAGGLVHQAGKLLSRNFWFSVPHHKRAALAHTAPLQNFLS